MTRLRRPYVDPTTPKYDPYALRARWGDDLIDRGFVGVPRVVIQHYHELGIEPMEMMTCVHIFAYWWTPADPYPSIGTLAEQMGVSKRQVSRYIQSLVDKGYLEVQPRYVEGKGQRSNEYNFTALLKAIRDHIETVHGGVA